MGFICIEEPAHLQPDCFGIYRCHRIENAFGDFCKSLRVPERGIHFIERIHSVNMIGAVELGLLFEKLFLDDSELRVHRAEESAAVLVCKSAPIAYAESVEFLSAGLGQCSRYVTGKGRKYRLHTQRAFALQDAFLQLYLAVNPLLRKRTLPAVKVAHPLPRQMGRSHEELANLLIAHPVLTVNLLPDCLLTGDGKRHIDSVEGHPVDEALPLVPIPPRHSVAEGAVVEEEPLRHGSLNTDFGRNRRHCLRQFHRIVIVPAHICKAVFLQVAVETDSHRIGVVAPYNHLGAYGFEFVCVLLSIFKQFETHCRSFLSKDSFCETAGASDFRVTGN